MAKQRARPGSGAIPAVEHVDARRRWFEGQIAAETRLTFDQMKVATGFATVEQIRLEHEARKALNQGDRATYDKLMARAKPAKPAQRSSMDRDRDSSLVMARGPTHLPTRQTVRRMQRDTLDELLRKKQIAPEHYDAAIEIRDTFEAVTSAMFARAQSYDPADYLGTGRHFEGRAVTVRRWRRYKAWAPSECRVYLGQKTYLAVVLDVLVDGLTIGQIERECRVRRGHDMVQGVMRDSLGRYAHLAGWQLTAGVPNG